MTMLTRMLAAVALLAVSLPATGQEDYDRWYVLEWSGQRAGWMHQSQETEGGRITTRNETSLSLKRGPTAIDVEMDLTWVETVEGEPVRIVHAQRMSAGTVRQRYEFEDGRIRVETTQQGRTRTTTMEAPEGEWLAPAASAREFHRLLEEGAQRITQSQLQPGPMGLQVVTTTYTGIEETTLEVMGKVVPAYRAESVTSMPPGARSVIYVDERGVALKDEMDIGFATLTTIAADRAVALSELDPPEVMERTFVDPEGAIEGDPRRLRAGSYVLRAREGDLPEIPETAVQRVSRLGEDAARVVVDLDSARPAGEVDRGVYLAASTLADSTDERIVELAGRATRGAGDEPAARAEALRRFVYDFVDEKSLAVGVATASEVCRTGQGDCTEHAVLLAALLRAEGIPSRTASGLVYVDRFLEHEEIFGYHMWAQALLEVDGEATWVDLDGTMPGDRGMDATHIALSVSSMADGEAFEGLIGMVPLMGNLEIEIE